MEPEGMGLVRRTVQGAQLLWLSKLKDKFLLPEVTPGQASGSTPTCNFCKTENSGSNTSPDDRIFLCEGCDSCDVRPEEPGELKGEYLLLVIYSTHPNIGEGATDPFTNNAVLLAERIMVFLNAKNYHAAADLFRNELRTVLDAYLMKKKLQQQQQEADVQEEK
jgi:hypothetical protein